MTDCREITRTWPRLPSEVIRASVMPSAKYSGSAERVRSGRTARAEIAGRAAEAAPASDELPVHLPPRATYQPPAASRSTSAAPAPTARRGHGRRPSLAGSAAVCDARSEDLTPEVGLQLGTTSRSVGSK